mmetsp:Transcript_6458/g.12373  ORF Transcript_6458/g.12373 Transcript_6458/m.12373 type:complete len:651 (+) Transcript_6458:155-2107(+)
MRKTILSRIVETPVTWLLIVLAAILTSVFIGALSIQDVIKELVVVTSATVVLVFMGGMRIRTRTNKSSGKACKEPCKASTCPLPVPSAQQRPMAGTPQFQSRPLSMAPRTFGPLGIEKHTAAPAARETPESRQASKRPVLPPTFASADFNDQADELSTQLLPTERCQGVVKEIAQDVKKIILSVLPYADVVGFTNGEVSRGTAYGVAVPEVDIVVNLPPHILVRTLQSQISKLNFSGKVDDRRLHKSGLRMCTDMLVTSGGFKFRRSAFRGRDPKVTLMAPRSLDDAACVPIDFSVNAATPLCNHVLVTACAQVDPRAQMLILLVKRWAKDRGICHAAKGHLMPYAWTLLCIYFLQVGVKGGSILPPFKHLRLALQDSEEVAGLANCLQGWHAPSPGSALGKKRLGQLFKEFVNFYLEIDWSVEAVSIRWGQRAPPARSLKLNVLETPMGSVVGPSIEDPFMPNENMSEMLTAIGLSRLREELTRAKVCCESSAPLSEILTQWVPPEQRAQVDPSDGADIGDGGDVGEAGEGGNDVDDGPDGGVDDGNSSGDEAETNKGSSSTVTPGTGADANTDSTLASTSGAAPSEQSEPPLPPWRKKSAAVGGPACTAAKSSPALPKQHMAPPPGLWVAKGKPPTAWPTPEPTKAVA